jgi:hypothetical protein
VYDTAKMVESLLMVRWKEVQLAQEASARHWAPSSLNLAADISLSLTNSRPYLRRILNEKLAPRTSEQFQPRSLQRLRGVGIFSASADARLSATFQNHGYFALADFEDAVEAHLDNWVNENLLQIQSSTTIAELFTQYSTAALQTYKSDPELMSIMLLTLSHLWVGLDKLAVAQCPLLSQFSPEVPLGLLKDLLLRRAKSFQRLKSFEEYLRLRHSLATSGCRIFTDHLDGASFAVCYFNISHEQQEILATIEQHAQTLHREKVEELEGLNAKYKSLMDRAHNLEHDYNADSQGHYRHARRCSKCSVERQAGQLKIDVFEWPLPDNILEAKRVVFELCPPLAFRNWRDITYRFLHDICTPSTRSPGESPSVLLHQYVGLHKYESTKASHVTLASISKPFSKSHYRSVKIPKQESSVCVNHGPHWM